MKITYQVLPLIVGLGLMGCQQAPENTAKKDAADSTAETQFVSKLPETAPVVKVGTEANYAPYEFKDEYGNVTGFDIDLIREIGEDQGFKVEIYNDPWEQLFTNLDSKSRDMITAGITYSDERASKYLLSNPYLPLPSTLIYLNDKFNIKSTNDFKGLRIGVLSNSAQSRYFADHNYGISAMIEYPTTFAAVQAMAQNKVDAVASDSGVLRYTMNDLPDLKAKYYDYENITEYGSRTVFVIDKDKPDLLKKINIGLQDLKDNGTYAKLTTKWFGTDLTKASMEQQSLLEGKSSVAPTAVTAQ